MRGRYIIPLDFGDQFGDKSIGYLSEVCRREGTNEACRSVYRWCQEEDRGRYGSS